MTSRLSSNQFTILKTIASKPLVFHRAVEVNQAMFMSLIKHGYVGLDLPTESFRLTQEGHAAYDLYRNGHILNLTVKNNPQSRQERVGVKLGKPDAPPKKPMGAASSHSKEPQTLKKLKRSITAKIARVASKGA